MSLLNKGFLIFLCVFNMNLALATPVIWKVQSNKPLKSGLLAVEQRMGDAISRDTQGELVLQIRSEEGYVGLREAFTALRLGKIDAMFMNPQYWAGADPVFPIMGDLVAAWNSADEYERWLRDQDGIRYLEAAYQKFGLQLIGYIVAPTESLVSVVPIANIADLKGQMIRTPPGMVSDLFQLLGAKARNIDFLKTKASLVSRQVTVADLSHVELNNELGLYRLAKHTNFPGFHSTPLYDFVVNQNAWESLSLQQREVVQVNINQWQALTNQVYAQQRKNLFVSLQKQNVTVYRWNQDEIKKVRERAAQVWSKYASKSVEAAALVADLKQWLRQIGNIE